MATYIRYEGRVMSIEEIDILYAKLFADNNESDNEYTEEVDDVTVH